MILVTGATGHVGNTLVHALAQRGEELRLFVQADEPVKALHGLRFELLTGDISQPDDVMQACAGVDYVYHLAGLIDITSKKSDLLKKVNVDGTVNVVRACLAQKVKRLVYISSVHALPEPPMGVPFKECEASAFPDPNLYGPYAVTKSAATAAVYEGIKAGLDAVMLFPSGIIGPGDYRGSEIGRVVRYLLGKQHAHSFACFDGKYNFVDVRDIADALQSAMKNGRSGEGYLIAGHSLSVSELYRKVLQAAGRSSIKLVMLPLALVKIAARLVVSFARLFKRKPFFTPYSIGVLQSNSEIDSSKAERELGFKARPLDETLSDTIAWFKQGKPKAGVSPAGQRKLKSKHTTQTPLKRQRLRRVPKVHQLSL